MRAASAVDIALWDLFGKAAEPADPPVARRPVATAIRTYNTCAGYTYNKRGARRVHRRRTRSRRKGPTRTRSRSIDDAGALAQSLLEEGITAMKIWPFDPFAVASGGNFIHRADLDKALRPVPPDPRRCRRQDGGDGRAALDVGPALRAGDRARAAGVPAVLGGGSDQDAGPATPSPSTRRGPAFRSAPARRSRRARSSSNCCARARPTT